MLNSNPAKQFNLRQLLTLQYTIYNVHNRLNTNVLYLLLLLQHKKNLTERHPLQGCSAESPGLPITGAILKY